MVSCWISHACSACIFFPHSTLLPTIPCISTQLFPIFFMDQDLHTDIPITFTLHYTRVYTTPCIPCTLFFLCLSNPFPPFLHAHSVFIPVSCPYLPIHIHAHFSYPLRHSSHYSSSQTILSNLYKTLYRTSHVPFLPLSNLHSSYPFHHLTHIFMPSCCTSTSSRCLSMGKLHILFQYALMKDLYMRLHLGV